MRVSLIGTGICVPFLDLIGGGLRRMGVEALVYSDATDAIEYLESRDLPTLGQLISDNAFILVGSIKAKTRLKHAVLKLAQAMSIPYGLFEHPGPDDAHSMSDVSCDVKLVLGCEPTSLWPYSEYKQAGHDIIRYIPELCSEDADIAAQAALRAGDEIVNVVRNSPARRPELV